MSNKWLLVLGAGSDMAQAVARQFAKNGWSMHLASRNTENLEAESANLAVRFGVEARSHFFDALDLASHASFYKQLDPAPEGVVLAFGTMDGDVETVINTNFTGAANILEIIADDFETRQTGFIVGISSVAGDRGRQSNYRYGSAKAGLTAFLSGLRHRLFSSGVPVLTVKPGFTATQMTEGMDLPERLTAKPDDVGEAVFRRVKKSRGGTLYVKPVWRYIMLIIIHLPDFIFNRTKL